MKISCPSKTFLSGEYAVIGGGPAILIATPPYFVLDNDVFKDPYEGAGGFGASGARFVLNLRKLGYKDVWQVWRRYRCSGRKGSGADVVVQWMGGLTFFHAEKKIIETLQWPFPDLLIGLIHTGFKVNTYKHLETLEKNQFPELKTIVLNMYDALKNKDQECFLETIHHYASELQKFSLVCDNTQKILSQMNEYPDILAAKGCGAMGSDVVLCVIEKNNKKSFLKWATSEKFNIVFCDNQFAKGIL